MLNLVKRPFKSNGVFYPAGTVIQNPAGIHLYKTKLKDGKIIVVDEHNVDSVAHFFLHRHGLNIKEKLLTALKPAPKAPTPPSKPTTPQK